MKARRALNADDLYALTQAQREVDQPCAVCAALETLSAQVIEHRLFTVMRASRAFSICESRSAPTDCASATMRR